MKKLAHVLAGLLLIVLSRCAFPIEPDETGLKTGGELTVYVVIPSLQAAETILGLINNEEMREAELRILRHGN